MLLALGISCRNDRVTQVAYLPHKRVQPYLQRIEADTDLLRPDKHPYIFDARAAT